MFLFFAVIAAALAIAVLIGGDVRRLSQIRIRHIELLLAAFAVKVAVALLGTAHTEMAVTVARPLQAESVASFYRGTLETLESLGIAVTINTKPQEVADPVPLKLALENEPSATRILLSETEQETSLSAALAGSSATAADRSHALAIGPVMWNARRATQSSREKITMGTSASSA